MALRRSGVRSPVAPPIWENIMAKKRKNENKELMKALEQYDRMDLTVIDKNGKRTTYLDCKFLSYSG